MTLDAQMEGMIREFSAEPAPEEGPSWSRVAVRYLLAALDEARATIERRDGVIKILERDVLEAQAERDLQRARAERFDADAVALHKALDTASRYLPYASIDSTYNDGIQGVRAMVRDALATHIPGAPMLTELEALREVAEAAYSASQCFEHNEHGQWLEHGDFHPVEVALAKLNALNGGAR